MARSRAGGFAGVVIGGSSGKVGFARANLIEDMPMTDEMTGLKDLLAKSADADLLREMIGFAAERLMEIVADGDRGRRRRQP